MYCKTLPTTLLKRASNITNIKQISTTIYFKKKKNKTNNNTARNILLNNGWTELYWIY